MIPMYYSRWEMARFFAAVLTIILMMTELSVARFHEAPADSQELDDGDWRYTERMDRMTDKNYYSALAIAEECISGKRTCGIRISCGKFVEGSQEDMLLTEIHFGEKISVYKRGDPQGHEITYRLDNTHPVTENWLLRSSDAVAMAWYPTFVIALTEHNQLLLRTRDFEGNQLDRTISLHGSHKPIMRVMRACGYDE